MKNFTLNRDIDLPLYIQVYKYFKYLIDENKLEEDKLPSIRNLSKSLGVNNVTVVSAYNLLEKEGYVYSIKGSGTYIKRLPLKMTLPYIEEGDMELMASGILPISKDSINFASVSPTPDLFPIKDFKQSLIQVLDRDQGLAFLYPEITGYDPLRASISKFLLDNYNTKINKEEILITSGGQQGLDIVAKTLISPGDYILVENPTYSAALSAFQSRGAKIIGIPMEKDGIDIDLLKSYVNRYKPKFFYVMTNFQSPTTFSYGEEKKKQIISLARDKNFYIIEDDFLTDLYFDDNKKLPLKSMDSRNNVVFIKSFSKVFMPGVRIGFVTLPSELFTQIIKAKHTTDVTSSGYLQRAF
ncbi:MAG TPA: PLP-dependent aminotransferase family protein, partial [Tissierellaceae bacterium]|nr:PLP-dependent aminotransferase family protein [Tissierellaceae bacterium]